MIRLSCPSRGISFEVAVMDLSIQHTTPQDIWTITSYFYRDDDVIQAEFTNGTIIERFIGQEEGHCLKCGQIWASHDFGVPLPHCP